MKSDKEYMRILYGTPRREEENEILARLKSEHNKKNQGSESFGKSDLKNVIYELMDNTSTYALGAEALRNAAQDPHPKHNGIYRPLTFAENIGARVNDYNTLTNKDGSFRTEEERKRLFTTWFDSCTGIAYKGKDKDGNRSTKFKIIPECHDLIIIPKGFNEEYIDIDYSSITGIELDSANDIYNESMSSSDILNHEGWNTAVPDKILLTEYTKIISEILDDKDEFMGFFIRQNPNNDELRTLCVDSILDNNSDAFGENDLDFICRFLRVVAPK